MESPIRRSSLTWLTILVLAMWSAWALLGLSYAFLTQAAPETCRACKIGGEYYAFFIVAGGAALSAYLLFARNRSAPFVLLALVPAYAAIAYEMHDELRNLIGSSRTWSDLAGLKFLAPSLGFAVCAFLSEKQLHKTNC